MQRRIGRNTALLILVGTLLAYAGWAGACGFHDRNTVARGIMNHVYPNSLHVIGAIMQAQRAGELPALEPGQPQSYRLLARGPKRDALEQRAFEDTLDALYALGVAMDEQEGRESSSGVALVVLDTLMWTRYSGDYLDARQGLHVKGPQPGDIVLVTDSPVVIAIQSGQLTIDRAVELGVIRVYAEEPEGSALLAHIGPIGEAPLPHDRDAANLFGVSSSDWTPEDPLRPTQ